MTRYIHPLFFPQSNSYKPSIPATYPLETTKTTTASKNETTVQTAENQTTEAKQEQSCEFLISCKTVLSNKSALQSNYQVPSGGKIYEKKMEFQEGDTVMDVLKRTGVDIDVSFVFFVFVVFSFVVFFLAVVVALIFFFFDVLLFVFLLFFLLF